MKRINCNSCEHYKKKGYESCDACLQFYPKIKPSHNIKTIKKPGFGYYICHCNQKKDCYEHMDFCEDCFSLKGLIMNHGGKNYCHGCYEYRVNSKLIPGSYAEEHFNLPTNQWYDFYH